MVEIESDSLIDIAIDALSPDIATIQTAGDDVPTASGVPDYICEFEFKQSLTVTCAHGDVVVPADVVIDGEPFVQIVARPPWVKRIFGITDRAWSIANTQIYAELTNALVGLRKPTHARSIWICAKDGSPMGPTTTVHVRGRAFVMSTSIRPMLFKVEKQQIDQFLSMLRNDKNAVPLRPSLRRSKCSLFTEPELVALRDSGISFIPSRNELVVARDGTHKTKLKIYKRKGVPLTDVKEAQLKRALYYVEHGELPPLPQSADTDECDGPLSDAHSDEEIDAEESSEGTLKY
jgi:hypothetical protein